MTEINNIRQSYFFTSIYQLGRTFDTKNNTKEDCNQDGTRIRRCAVYVLDNPYQECYTEFFVDGEALVGLRTGHNNLRRIRYICQPPTRSDKLFAEYFYATMFDESYGIAVFSAYKLSQANANFPGQQQVNPDWHPTPGNVFQPIAK